VIFLAVTDLKAFEVGESSHEDVVVDPEWLRGDLLIDHRDEASTLTEGVVGEGLVEQAYLSREWGEGACEGFEASAFASPIRADDGGQGATSYGEVEGTDDRLAPIATDELLST